MLSCKERWSKIARLPIARFSLGINSHQFLLDEYMGERPEVVSTTEKDSLGEVCVGYRWDGYVRYRIGGISPGLTGSRLCNKKRVRTCTKFAT